MTSSRQSGQFLKTKHGWSVRWYDHAGQRKQRGTFPTKTEARTVLTEELRKVRLGASYKPTNLTLNELVAKYLEQYDAAPSSVKWLKYFLRFSQDAFGAASVTALTPHDIAIWRSRLGSDHEKHGATRALKQVLQAAVRWGWLNVNVAAQDRNPQPRSIEQHPFESWLDVEAITESMERDRDVALVYLAVGTGLRPEEYFALEWKDVDLDKGIISVQRAFAKGRLKGYTKTERGRRTVPLRDKVRDQLAALERPYPLVFPSTRGGGHIDLQAWRRNVWVPAFTMTTVGRRRPYDCRHTYATWSIAAGVDLFTLSRRMGASLVMIDRHYGHLMADADVLEQTKLNDWDSKVGDES